MSYYQNRPDMQNIAVRCSPEQMDSGYLHDALGWTRQNRER